MSDKCPVDHASRGAWLKRAKASSASPQGGCPVNHNGGEDHCSSDRQEAPNLGGPEELSAEREISSIPRAGQNGNWIYPSEKQFFTAMKRKNFDPDAKDMHSIIPIHNAVNERAWNEILKWETGRGSEACGGPKLVRFEGDSKKITPTARWNMWFNGYEKPFDRHDWLVDRCGTEIEYVIDFYTGKPNPMIPDMPSFYLDARPKLNSIEGIKMRVSRFFGF